MSFRKTGQAVAIVPERSFYPAVPNLGDERFIASRIDAQSTSDNLIPYT